MRINLFTTILFLVWVVAQTDVFAQSPQQYERFGDDAAYERAAWDEAFGYYKQAYDLDSSSFLLRKKLADAAREVKYYPLAYRLYTQNYLIDEGNSDPNALFYMALLEKTMGRDEDAQRNFKKFSKKSRGAADKELVEIATHEVKASQWALNNAEKKDTPDSLLLMMMGPDCRSVKWKKSKLPANIIGSASEIAPLQMHTTFYYSDYADNKWRVHMADVLYDSVRTQANPPTFQNIRSVPGMPEVEGSQANFSQVGDRVYFSQVIGDFTKLMTGSWDNDHIVTAYEMDIVNGDGGINTMPHVAVIDGIEYLFFVSDRPSFDKPINMGKTYNSTFNELSPSVAVSRPDGRCNFYFASNKPDSLKAESACCNDLYVVSAVMQCGDKNVDTTQTILNRLMKELPVVLYFHNDEPNPKTLDTTTTLTYMDAYRSYSGLKEEYIRENSKGLEGELKEDKEEITRDFFELKVDKGAQDLDRFSAALLEELNAGRSFRLYVRGFASPRAKTDYNLNLTKRRTASLVNFLKADSSGVFVPYLNDEATNGAKLEVVLLPFGELKADMTVSDNLSDERNSIYNRAACLERRIEIEEVIFIPSTNRKSMLELSEPCIDFGIIPARGSVQHEFLLCNNGYAPMVIDSVTTECGCTTPTLDKYIVLPGEFATLVVGFDPLTRQGKDIKEVYVHIAGEKPRVILLEAERRK